MNNLVTGVSAHITGDMPTALQQAYSSYIAKYYPQNPPHFDSFKNDFFE